MTLRLRNHLCISGFREDGLCRRCGFCKSCALAEASRGALPKFPAENANHSALWIRISNDESLVRCENLLQMFKMRSLENREAKLWIQQVFYLVSIVLLLFTLFFVIRSRK